MPNRISNTKNLTTAMQLLYLANWNALGLNYIFITFLMYQICFIFPLYTKTPFY